MKNNVVGIRIKELRKSKGWTQSDLATQCQLRDYEMSRETIAKIESGIRLIMDTDIIEFALVLDVSIVELFDVPDLKCQLS
ncbi:helix-turn-helix domain-containing protein [Vibrio parahaemolyticus]|uniref:helix-turn-helix domain-containing protein n=1 Tax=Vibrio parahaemolyticus TaxID=670 RepID=UPI00111F2986|nr:helix-turn-helix transcriptional regulator [Vibrio parahaemolyticus]TOM96826.1 transcriptional regulator [Vibrio parahaemolyticus]